MKRLLGFLIAPLALLALSAPPVHAQEAVKAVTVSACGTPNNTPVVGSPYPVTMDTTGVLCTSSTGGGGGGAVTIADGADQATGSKADLAYSGSGSGSVISILKRFTNSLVACGSNVCARSVAFASDGTVLDPNTPVPVTGDVTLSAKTTGGCTSFDAVSTASTNSTLVIAGAHTLCHIEVINTTATIAYLRMYDSGTAPTCSSSTGAGAVRPALATGGVAPSFPPQGVAYANGISFCISGGGSKTDNTNAVAGVYIVGSYK